MRPSAKAQARVRQRARERAREPGRKEWQKRRTGLCAVCGTHGPVVNHHVVTESLVRKFKGDPWDLRNALQVGAPRVFGGNCEPNCHDEHHHIGVNDRRISCDKIPPAAVEFARELMGDDLASDYFRRCYRS